MKTKSLILAALLCSSAVVAQNQQVSSIINSSTSASTTQTKYGKVCGFIYKGVYTYKGIPFAQAKRFEMPQPPTACRQRKQT